MTKAPQAFRTISEVSETLDVQQHVLRFWESKFPQIKPLKRAGGRRYYRPEDIELLRGVKTLLYREGYTIKGVQKLLRDSGARYVGEIGRFGFARNGRGPALDTLPTEIDAGVGATDHGLEDDANASIMEGSETSEPAADTSDALLAERRAKLEAALSELLTLRDLLRAARPKVEDAA